MNKQSLFWFQNQTCETLEIKDFKQAADPSPQRSKVISDSGRIQRLMDAIQKLPVTGEMMISFTSTVPYVELRFQCPSGVEKIQFYGGRIKTPATSFYKSSNTEEKEIFQMVQDLLSDR